MVASESSTDRIEKQVRLRAPRARVWRALTDAHQFGQWFGVALNGAIAPGASLGGRITLKGYEHLHFEMLVEVVQAESRFSFRWHPFAIDPAVDYSNEPMTLVVFTLEDAADGVLLTVVESGFDKIPASRRIKAFEMNSQGWATQMRNIERYLAA
jgi:uncharacterized protein YndB with AHSA1/START domain